MIEDKPILDDEELAVLAAENSRLELGPVDTREQQEVIDFLDDREENALNDYVRNNVAIKMKIDARKMVN